MERAVLDWQDLSIAGFTDGTYVQLTVADWIRLGGGVELQVDPPAPDSGDLRENYSDYSYSYSASEEEVEVEEGPAPPPPVVARASPPRLRSRTPPYPARGACASPPRVSRSRSPLPRHSPGCTTQRTRESPSWRKRQRKRLKPSCECQPTSPGDHQPFRHNRGPGPVCLTLHHRPAVYSLPFHKCHADYHEGTSHPTGSCSQLPPAHLGLVQETVTKQPLPRISGISPGGAEELVLPWRCIALLTWVLQHREFTVTKYWVSFLHRSLIPSAKSHRTGGCDAFFFLTFFFAYRCASKPEIGQQEGDSQPTRRRTVHLGHNTLEVHCSSRLGATTQGVHCHQGLTELQSRTRDRYHLQSHIAQKVVTAFSFTLFFAYRCASKIEIGLQKGDSQPTRRTRAHLGHITLEVRCSFAWLVQHREFIVTKDWLSFLSQRLITPATSHRTEGCDTFFFRTFFLHPPLRQQNTDWTARRWLSTNEKDEGASWAQHLGGALLLEVFSPGYYNTGNSLSPQTAFPSWAHVCLHLQSHIAQTVVTLFFHSPFSFTHRCPATEEKKNKQLATSRAAVWGRVFVNWGGLLGTQKKKQHTRRRVL